MAAITIRSPPVVTPEGLSSQRQWYLYNKIREFVPIEAQDLVCPLPRKRPPMMMMNNNLQLY